MKIGEILEHLRTLFNHELSRENWGEIGDEIIADVAALHERAESHSTAQAIDVLALDCYDVHCEKGFHDKIHTLAHCMGMAMTELAEVIELERKSAGPFTVPVSLSSDARRERDLSEASEKIPAHTKLEEELADVILRILDTAATYGCNIGAAVMAKLDYNRSRPVRHGKQY